MPSSHRNSDFLRMERRHDLTQRLVLQAGSVFVESDAKTGLFRVSQEIREMFGLPMEGETAHVEDLFAPTHPDDLKQFLEMRQASVETGKIFEIVVRIIRPDGDIRHIRVIAGADTHNGDRQALLIDVTEAVLATERDDRSKALLGLVSDLAKLGGWRRDLANDRLEDTGNLNEIFELPSGPLNFDAALSCYDDLGRADVLAARNRVIQEQVEISGEYEITALNGTKKSIRVLQRPVLSPEGQTIATLGAIQDISETVTLRRQAEEKASHLQNTLDNMPEAFFLLDLNLRFTYANAAATKIFVRSLGPNANCLGMSLAEVFPMAEPQLREPLAKLVKDGEPVTVIVDLPSVQLIRRVDAYRTPNGIGMHHRDVTKEVRAQTDLRNSEERYRLALQASRDVLFDWNIDDDELMWSDAAQTLFGYDRNAIRTTEDWLSRVHPGDRDRMRLSLATSTRPGSDELWSDEYRLVRADGSTAHVLDRAILLLNAERRPVRMIGTITDVSELREEEQRLRAIIDVAADAIFEFDPNRRVVIFSEGILTHFGHAWVGEQSIPTPWEKAVHPDDIDRVLSEFALFCAGTDQHWRTEYRLMRGDGTEAAVRVKTTAVRDDQDGLDRVIGSMEDITQQRRAEERLKQAERVEAIGNLTGGMAHDFNNLLTIVLGNAELLEENPAMDADSRERAAVILRAAERGAELTASLLAFAGKQALVPKTLDTAAALAEVERLLVWTLPANIDLEIILRDDLWLVEADPAQLNAAILNLVVNARDAMAEGGKLLIECTNAHLDEAYTRTDVNARPGDFLRIAVTDTGTGMTPEVAAKVFEPFFTTKSRGTGTGLGLSMVRGFVQQSGGHVTVYTEPGHGTTISLYLPRSHSERVEPDSGRDATTLVGLGEHVLVVEDNPLLLPHVAEMVEGFGYRVSTAANATEAMAVLSASGVVDLLFTDVVLPGEINGPRLATQAVAARPGLRVLFTSGYTGDALVHHGRLDSSVDLLSKPYRRQELARKLREALDRAV